jgi:hypothetical protein
MKINVCRLCRGESLTEILDLGELRYSGTFPFPEDDKRETGNLVLLLCETCALVQLDRNFPPELLYGDNYGYRSGLNQSMVKHLRTIATTLASVVELRDNDVVLDIGSNDGTLLRSYKSVSKKIGIDPTGAKFAEFYDEASVIVPDFFSAENFQSVSLEKAKIVTSIAMLYDLEDPVKFAKDIHKILADDGVWYFEQSYMPWMINTGAYDTVCHEHLEYYSYTSLKHLMDLAGFEALSVSLNDSNGGSIAITARKKKGVTEPYSGQQIQSYEDSLNLRNPESYTDFRDAVEKHAEELRELCLSITRQGKSIYALGASTKGSIVIQRAGLTSNEITAVGEVNEFKFGRLMAGSDIPIVSEAEVLKADPDYILVLPWHFRETFDSVLREYSKRGGQVIYPLPTLSIV